MLKISIIIGILAVVVIIPLRFGISAGGFFRDGIVEGLQACKLDSDCVWVPRGCCECFEGGREMLINKDKEWLHKLLVKDVCLEERTCPQDNFCHDDEVFCDRTCKTGKKAYSKPLLVK